MREIAVHPRRRGVLFVATSDGIFRSNDSGRTWHRSGLRGSNAGATWTFLGQGLPGAAALLDLEAAPFRHDTIYAASIGGLFVIAQTTGP